MIEMLMPYIIVTAIWVPLLLLRRWVDARHVRNMRGR